MLFDPYQGEYKHQHQQHYQYNEPADEYSVFALAKRLNITIEDMKQMSFVSLINVLISSIEDKEDKEPTQQDIDNAFG